jgi:Chlamydia polymorphic membrane protein (Chlamydia_PMP) repeat
MTPMNTQMKTFNSNTCRLLFSTCLSALCFIALSTQAAMITVTNSNDSGAGSLRQALANAVDGDTINFDSSLDGQTITLTSGELSVNKSVTVSGPGADTLAVSGNATSRVFVISPGKTVTISGLTITNASTNVYGGGIFNFEATLTVNNCTVSGNSAFQGGGIFNDGFFGSATLTINDSTLDGNSSTSYGGAIYNGGQGGSATLSVNNCTVSGNSGIVYGGGIFNDGRSGRGTVTINNSTLSGNSVRTGDFGGGIFNDGRSSGNAILTIDNSTLSGNSASYGGGIYNYGSQGSATLTVANSTFNDNSSVSGGIDNEDGTLTIGDTILKGGASGWNITNWGTVTSLGYNLSSDNAGGDNTTGPGGLLNHAGDIRNTDPMLGPLQDNGGPTFTHALLLGSPAFDAGDPNFNPPPDYDQRGLGFPRVVNGRIDIGAFESHFTPTPTPTPTSTPTATATATATSTPTATATATATATSTPTATATATATPTPTPAYAAQVQPPINPDGSSTFNVRRGVVPVKFNLTLGGVATCDLPLATIAVTRTAGGVIGEINESDYSGNADTGSNFRIDSCQYVYNLNSRALGVGTYRVDILIDGQVVGSTVFGLN